MVVEKKYTCIKVIKPMIMIMMIHVRLIVITIMIVIRRKIITNSYCYTKNNKCKEEIVHTNDNDDSNSNNDNSTIIIIYDYSDNNDLKFTGTFDDFN